MFFRKNTPQIPKIQEIRLTTAPICDKMRLANAGVAELADALDLGSNTFGVQVQVLLPVPNRNNPNFVIAYGVFGFSVFFTYPNFNSKKGEG